MGDRVLLVSGVLAQLVERNNGIVEVTGSNPVHSIPPFFLSISLISFSKASYQKKKKFIFQKSA